MRVVIYINGMYTCSCFVTIEVSFINEIPHLLCDAFREANQTPAGKKPRWTQKSRVNYPSSNSPSALFTLCVCKFINAFISSIIYLQTISSVQDSNDFWREHDQFFFFFEILSDLNQAVPITSQTRVKSEFYWPKVSVRIKCKGGEER